MNKINKIQKVRKFPEASDRKLELRMLRNGPKRMKKRLVLFQLWQLD